MKFFVLFFLCVLGFNYTFGQFFYDFESDTSLAKWQGDTSQYEIRNGILSLNGNSDKALILHASSAIDSTTWELDFSLDFNPSSNNYFIIYLVLSGLNPEESDGYYLKVGGSKDNLSLYKINQSNVDLILEGKEDRLNFSKVGGSIKIMRSIYGEWELYSKINQESEFSLEGQTFDNAFFVNHYFGLECVYTSTRKDRFHFDNLRITGNPYRDRIAPNISSIHVLSKNNIAITFNEAVDVSTMEVKLMDDGLSPDSSYFEKGSLQLVFSNLPNAKQMQLVHSGFKDMSDNFSPPDTLAFFCLYEESPSHRDIVISEIMADPSPPIDLPEMEYIEIFNRSEKYFNLSNWILTDNNSFATLDSLIIGPQEFVLINQKFNESFTNESYQSMVPAKWPSLNNSGDSIRLFSKDSILIDLLAYDLSYYQDEEKSTGGYSIESIDPNLPCQSKTNWSASQYIQGGTPGIKNSNFTIDSLTLLNEQLIDPNIFLFTFSKSIHCTDLKINSPGVRIISFNCEDNLLYAISKEPYPSGNYPFKIENLKDCYGKEYSFQFEVAIDRTAPEIISVSNIYQDQVEIVFSEPVANISNLKIEEVEAEVFRYDSRLDSISVKSELLRPGNFQMAIELEDTLKNKASYIVDLSISKPEIAEFTHLVVTEYLPNPIEESELPPYEFIEIYNRTNKILPLRGYRIGDRNRTVEIEDGFINPLEYVILCPNSALHDFQHFGKAIPIKNWPSINNDSDSIIFLNSDNEIIFQLYYDRSNFDYSNRTASIEKIDLDRFCDFKENWSLSSSKSFGTPGKINSNSRLNPDIKAPSIVSAILIQPDKIRFTSSETIHPLDTLSLEISSSQAITHIQKSWQTHFEVSFSDNFLANSKLQYRIKNLRDCNDNYSKELIGEIIIPGKPIPGNLIINEIMFDPESLVPEFIEILNHSNKYLQLSEIDLSVSETTVSLSEKTIFPNEYVVLTKDPELLLNRYASLSEYSIQKLNLPTLRNDSSQIKIAFEKATIDSARYNKSWHFELIDDPKGVSLERISPTSDGIKESSWFSASSTSGFATPGSRNSHFTDRNSSSNLFSVDPVTISPNNDGFQDIAFINYKTSQPGTMANLRIFDTRGNLIKELANNELLQKEGYFRWDGTDESGVPLETNYYLILIEVFNNLGFTKRERLKIGLFQNNF